MIFTFFKAPSSQYVISLKAVNKAGFGMEILKDVITKRKSGLITYKYMSIKDELSLEILILF